MPAMVIGVDDWLLGSFEVQMYRFLAIIVAALAVSCQSQPTGTEADLSEIKTMKDPHSYSRPDIAGVSHLDLRLKVDFDSAQISGVAVWKLEKSAGANEVIFDVKGLIIDHISSNAEDEIEFALGKEDPILGQSLTIPISDRDSQVTITYRTGKDAEALQWLTKAQTLGGKYPFLFTQSEAILARTWLPCQDAPGNRFSYNAEVSVPKGMLALMSATNPQTISADGKYTFKQPNKIPSYLMALAVGHLEFQSLGERTGVYSEPELLGKSAYEFHDVEKMLTSAEELYGPYRWGRYDLLVLPPSFPFGGMENPELTFATPTIIAGDRSLTSLVAHELAHSWSGNLVTNKTWNDFWLNEGFTVYFERRIMEHIYGADYAEMLAEIGYDDVKNTVEELGATSPDTRLKLELEGRNPDDGMTDIAYEKGYFLLKYLENQFGRKDWDAFITEYFSSQSFKSTTTEGFLGYLQEFAEEQGVELQMSVVQNWIYQPGLPDELPKPNSSRFRTVESAFKQFRTGSGFNKALAKQWSAHEWLHFVRQVDSTVSLEELARMDAEFNFTQSGNNEVLAAWLEAGIKRGYSPAVEAAESFLQNVGRRKFLVPIYKAMLANASSEEKARETYRLARPRYHAVAVNTLDKLLGYQSGK